MRAGIGVQVAMTVMQEKDKRLSLRTFPDMKSSGFRIGNQNF